ncbi:GNAT family N-acetyltransferase [Streptomyces sp. N2-109]|uniref:GNAT family N-acetyltransferase n=1 Tax=Streptomyces gossypii TaxID=2883101 RepID=A0ABT2JYD5_9ACTN|nr:GNAT family N-acetyltransferase [Streptomyces gossypii]MCT2592917.1 GNAT family N-acetyltransferase [Streptomyces gossypii]
MSLRLTPLTDPAITSAGHRLVWLATDEGRAGGAPLGTAGLRLFTRSGQDHLAELTLTVHPAERHRGVGSRLLAAAVAAAREHGRRSLVAEARAESPGARFLSVRGFRTVLTLTHARLSLSGATADSGVAADSGAAAGSGPLGALTATATRSCPGYRLVSWAGTVPDELAVTFAHSRHAMDDMPMDDTDYGTVIWDVERVRDAAAAIARRGDLLYTVAAVDESDGSIAGFTEIVVPGDGKGDGQHYGTGVLPAHRGHGLGAWMKAESVRQAAARHPELAGLLTDTADSNAYMRRINDALGYRPTHRTRECQLDL